MSRCFWPKFPVSNSVCVFPTVVHPSDTASGFESADAKCFGSDRFRGVLCSLTLHPSPAGNRGCNELGVGSFSADVSPFERSLTVRHSVILFRQLYVFSVVCHCPQTLRYLDLVHFVEVVMKRIKQDGVVSEFQLLQRVHCNKEWMSLTRCLLGTAFCSLTLHLYSANCVGRLNTWHEADLSWLMSVRKILTFRHRFVDMFRFGSGFPKSPSVSDWVCRSVASAVWHPQRATLVEGLSPTGTQF